MATLRTTSNPSNQRRPFQWRWLLIAGLCLPLLLIGGGLAFRLLQPIAPAQIASGQILAWEIARATGHATGVQLASGAYLPGDTLLLYSRIDLTDRARVRAWAQTQLEPFAERFALLPQNETFTWVIDFGPAPVEQEVIMAPLKRAADPSFYRYISAAPELFLASSVPLIAASTAPTEAIPAGKSLATPQSTIHSAPTPLPAQATMLGDLPLTTTVDINKDWLSLSGDWVANGGIYSQRKKQGFDFISMLTLESQMHYSLNARLRLVEGEMGGGFIYNAPSQTDRAGAQVIDMDKQGGFLRWGRYDAKGQYIYEGGMPLAQPLNDGQWHTLHLITHAGASLLMLDGRPVAKLTNTSTSGYFGLITSNAAVDFDSITVSVLPPVEAALLPMPAVTFTGTASSALTNTVTAPTNFNDDFADGNAAGWRVLNGTWQVVEQEYQQTGTDGFDLGSISAFQGDVYTVSVRLRWLDGSMGGGLYFNMTQRDAKMGSQMINYTRKGKALQWGHFDEGGNFVFEGSAPVADGGDGQWHTLMLGIRTGKATFLLDDKLIAKNVTLTSQGGYVGLLTSASKVAFDDIKIVTP
ncbi:MAG: hypothetical protein NT075_36370 [Chloroflexi bacterium]|nr:hypothetical protein [Chloroflexota bacterium]